jgi:hypothetical protein
MSEDALGDLQKVLPAEHPFVLDAAENVARILHDLGNYKRAYVLADKVMLERVSSLGLEDPQSRKIHALVVKIGEKLEIDKLEQEANRNQGQQV